jgi:hypothetical protein
VYASSVILRASIIGQGPKDLRRSLEILRTSPCGGAQDDEGYAGKATRKFIQRHGSSSTIQVRTLSAEPSSFT